MRRALQSTTCSTPDAGTRRTTARPGVADHRAARTIDGTYNNLDDPLMGLWAADSDAMHRWIRPFRNHPIA
ncbi:hypothetical protein I541_5577 [Mycobacteroides abscessus]|nr:hypothetical protein I541_5577 [Mycobacteroides abscessus]